MNFTATDAIAMLQLCSYETQALGYSAFCPLFSEEDFLNYEYYYDLVSLHCPHKTHSLKSNLSPSMSTCQNEKIVLVNTHPVILLQQRARLPCFSSPRQRLPPRMGRAPYTLLPDRLISPKPHLRQHQHLLSSKPIYLRRCYSRGRRSRHSNCLQPDRFVQRTTAKS